MNENKIIIDPIYGFINIPTGILLDIIKHPFMQRLTRIKQLGISSVVYPGAQHTRFQHSLGAYYLMTQAIQTLQEKGIFIFESEAEAIKAAILMHDIGHGPFSHVLESTLISGVSHEEISLMMMEQMNETFKGALTLAIKIFKNEYPKRFLHELISSQIDMDRLDYLRRDSFYTGVSEGNIGSARIIKMLNVADDALVVDPKGIYSLENYLTSRRSMYWQVYLHKTAVAYERMLINLLKRAETLIKQGKKLFATPALSFFLENKIDLNILQNDKKALEYYTALDDTDLWCTIKTWCNNDDKILSLLAKGFINRNLFKVEIHQTKPTVEYIEERTKGLIQQLDVSTEDIEYLWGLDYLEKDTYNVYNENIKIALKDGTLKDITEVSEVLDVNLLSKKNCKYCFSYHRL